MTEAASPSRPSRLFEVTPTDPPTFAAAGMVFVATAIMAALLPALRAARINPMQALRYD